MGSSPVTATTLLVVREALAPLPTGSERLGLAFSGGPDSLALLLALRQIVGSEHLVALHVDHGGPLGRVRRGQALRLAERCEIEFRWVRRPVDQERRSGESWETAARRLRYEALETLADQSRVDRIATAHHLEDQAETVVLRLRQGSDWMGLSGIAARRGRIVRPALALSKWQLRAFLDGTGLVAIQDPTNRIPRAARNRVRLFTLPWLVRESRISEFALAQILSGVAAAATSARARLSRRDLAACDSLAVRRFRASLTAIDAGIPAPGRAALEATRRGRSSSARFTGRGGFQWNRVTLRPWTEAERTYDASFSYTFLAPGRVELPQIGVALRVSREQVEPWMYEGRRNSAAFQLRDETEPLELEVRPRRPGDRLRPLGSVGHRKLKDLLIDRRIPAADRGRLPLLVHAGKIVWVPGVTVDEDFRLHDGRPCWVARLEPLNRLKEAY